LFKTISIADARIRRSKTTFHEIRLVSILNVEVGVWSEVRRRRRFFHVTSPTQICPIDELDEVARKEVKAWTSLFSM
jgi:hypothetical protein